ncbi:MAG: hypothetical protein Ct9H90mP6_08660 [Gammaproteobacteria bacterium]|nr:MAG: hypothetical protein Ct9H90mP6_08660 [Gammaproteobacteria bacterium]
MNTQLENKIYDTIVIGAGISGVSAAYHLKKYSPKADFLVLEGRDNFGGTWDLFKYPGIRAILICTLWDFHSSHGIVKSLLQMGLKLWAI